MKKILLLLIMVVGITRSHAQFIHKIKADSVLITNDSCTAELNLENSTKHINGFLYNKGNGRTEFRKAEKLNDSTLVFGDDTLVLRGAGNAWSITGNAGTDSANNFIGTIDSQDVALRTNNLERIRFTKDGKIGIGTVSPDSKLDIVITDTSLAQHNVVDVSVNASGFIRYRMTNAHSGISSATGDLYTNDAGKILQLYMGSTNNLYVANGAFIRCNGTGGMNISADIGPIAFSKNSVMGANEFARFLTNGNFGIGTQMPAYKLDVNGKTAIRTIDSTASAANMLYQDPATGEIKKTAVVPYKKYVALLSQSGTDAPTAIVLENTLGGTVTWSRNFTGNYTATLTGAFTQNKTWFSTEASDEAGNVVSTRMGWTSTNTVGLAVKDGTLANMDGWTNLSIEIRVYQ